MKRNLWVFQQHNELDDDGLNLCLDRHFPIIQGNQVTKPKFQIQNMNQPTTLKKRNEIIIKSFYWTQDPSSSKQSKFGNGS